MLMRAWRPLSVNVNQGTPGVNSPKVGSPGALVFEREPSTPLAPQGSSRDQKAVQFDLPYNTHVMSREGNQWVSRGS
ncbi:hypothetical protein RRG08_053518 [Elysia crispata]|uniref:Uncharacterized protein n=1 Tax=Elysia crispata TaxID=231223 RepID=A0AAE0Y2M5_9GAST|nr:hypothetical protein RRG08_053518 [Elysia crispata]